NCRHVFFFGTLKFFPTIVSVPLSEIQRSSARERPPRPRTSAITNVLVLMSPSLRRALSTSNRVAASIPGAAADGPRSPFVRLVLESPLRTYAGAEAGMARAEVREHRGGGEQVADEDRLPAERSQEGLVDDLDETEEEDLEAREHHEDGEHQHRLPLRGGQQD